MRINVDFWNVVDESQDPVDLRDVLQRAMILPPVRRMRAGNSGYTDYLAEAEIVGDQLIGFAARIRNENLPHKGNLQTGELNDLPLMDYEGVAEDMSFVYDHSLLVLVTQRQRMFQISALSNLLFHVTGQSIEFLPKLRKDVWAKLDSMTQISSVQFKLVGPSHHPNFSRDIPSMGRLLDDAENQFGATTAEIKLSVGRSRFRPLHGDLVKQVTALFKGSDNLKKLEVKGRVTEDETPELLDLLKGRLVFSFDVEYAGRRVDKTECQQHLRQAIRQHRQYLQQLL